MKKILVVGLVCCFALASLAVASEERSGKDIYEAHCSMCHASGVAGAPKFGSTADWKEHMEKGFDHMVAMGKKGEGAMPPMGGCNDCSMDEFKAAIHYMVDHSK